MSVLEALENALAFYWRCARFAWRGSWGKANAWQTVLGAIAVWVAASILGYTVIIPDTMEGGIILALVSIGAAWVVFFGLRLLAAPYRIFAEEQNRSQMLSDHFATAREQLRPKLKCSFNMNDLGCVRPAKLSWSRKSSTTLDSHTTSTTSTGIMQLVGGDGTSITQVHGDYRDSVLATYHRIKVETDGVGAVAACSGRLISITRDGQTVMAGENLLLPFAPAEADDATSKLVHNGAPEHLDFLAITHDDKIILPTHKFRIPSSFPSNAFSKHGEYVLSIVVLSPETVSVPIAILFNWTGDRKTSTLTQAS